MNRRQALGAMGAVVTAGCGERRFGAGTREPAAFETSISAPAELSLGEGFEVTVAVTNVGGSPGSYRGTIRAFAGMVHESEHIIELDSVPPEATRETTVGPIVTPYAGGWEIELVDEASQAVDVFPVAGDVGDTVEVDGLRLTVDSLSVADGYDYVTSTGRAGRRTPPSRRRLLFATIRVENGGDDVRTTPSRSEFYGGSADGSAPIYFSPESWDEYIRPDSPYPGKRRIDPGESFSGWVVLLVPAPADGVVAVVWNRDRVSSPPEALWRRT